MAEPDSDGAVRSGKATLPTFYYRDHFVEMLDFVARHYGHVLLGSHAALVDDFQALGHAEQCLYVRLVNRKGRLFATRRLRYPELGDVGPLLAGLRVGGWVESPGVEHFDDMLEFMTKDALHAAISANLVGVPRSLKKADLVAMARRHCEPLAFIGGNGCEDLVVQGRASDVRFLLYLYFGEVRDGLAQFTMRDLGLVRTQAFSDSYEPRFNDRDEALEHFYFAERLSRQRKADAGTIATLVDESDAWPEPGHPRAADLRDELAYRLGRRLEKDDQPYAALRVYEKGSSARSSERIVRLLLASKQRDEAKAWLERCLDDPQSDEEWLFARDVYAQKFGKKRTSALTDALRDAEVIEIDESLSGSPERAAASWFEQRGVEAWRVENAYWRTLFGLLFWDMLFEHERATLHSPFEFLPQSLLDGSFYRDNEARVEARLGELGNPAATTHRLLKISTSKYGTANGVFRWRRSIVDALFKTLPSADPVALAAMLKRLCQDYPNARYGYPDLLTRDRHGLRFIEIKTEGDQLRRNQLLRLEQLKAAGFRADVVRIRWTLDPAQVYVVVDVETTGGHGDNHRVTEIGAVKVQNGRVIDRFETLLNPQRSIPPGITRLTGITPAMVAGAPPFADVADDFETFFGDAIFVAHNVEFDYRFIAREFDRLGRPFRHPKLCTCASMRRLYPGHRSYSLAALTEAYNVPLRNHHRAMCDAEAAAELLLLVNEKRLEQLQAPEAGSA